MAAVRMRAMLPFRNTHLIVTFGRAQNMLMKLIGAPLLATAMMGTIRCEAEGVETNPYTGWFHADRVAILRPQHDYECENGIVGWFKLGGHDYAVIDFECDWTIDAVMREDGLLLMVLPDPSGDRETRSALQLHRSWLEFNPLEDVDWESVIDDETPSPFETQSTGRWMERHGLDSLEDGIPFTQSIFVDSWSLEDEILDVTIQTTSELRRVSPGDYGLSYQWFSARDERTQIDCWSIRAQGAFDDMAQWLVDCGFAHCRTVAGPVDANCKYIQERSEVECRRGGALVATFTVPR